MAVEKLLEIDLTKLTPDSIKKIDKQVQQIVEQFENPEQRSQAEKTVDPLLIPKSQKEEGLRKIFGRQTFSNLLSVGQNPVGFVTGQVTKLIPFIGTALLITGVIAAFVKQVDNFQKEFVDRVDERIDKFRSKQQQAQIQAGLQQLILTTATGSAEPRDAYNTFTVFNEDQSRIEADFQLRNTSGVD